MEDVLQSTFLVNLHSKTFIFVLVFFVVNPTGWFLDCPGGQAMKRLRYNLEAKLSSTNNHFLKKIRFANHN